MTVIQIRPGDEWPVAVSDGLSIPCHDCGEIPRFDYNVTDEFWNRWVTGRQRYGAVCLPCLDKRCEGVGLAAALNFVQFKGTGVTVELLPERRFEWKSRAAFDDEEAT